jgi:16S rRNA processing protein RimM
MSAGARICVGQIGAPHGVHGEVRLRSFTSDPLAVASYGPFETEEGRAVAIEALRPVKDHFVATLAGIRDRETATQLTNVKLYVPRARLPKIAASDEFYHADLVGLAAVDRTGKKLGTVAAIHNFGAGDLIEVRANDGKSQLIAFNETNVPTVDLDAGRIVIAPSPLAGEGGEAKPSRVRGSADKRSTARPVTRTAGGRRQRSTRSRPGRE